MRNRRWKFWPCIVATLLAIPPLYVTSFGVACWAVRGKGDEISNAFWSSGWTLQNGPRAFRAPILWFAKFGIGNGERLVLPASADGRHHLILEKGKPGFVQTWGPAPN
jgi:hypothetical protein